MKEIRFFVVPHTLQSHELPAEEAIHAIRVLRLKEGDEIYLMDGCGSFYRAAITLCNNKHCCYEVLETMPQQKTWKGSIHLAIAPTKSVDRMEWMAEKCTEIGFDQLSFIHSQFSERKMLRVERIEKILLSAVKQSRKPWMPVASDMQSFNQFVSTPRKGRKFIAHCYDELPREDFYDTLLKADADEDITVLVGPEGDFSVDEVRQALDHGFEPISLGKSRLRTETAGLVAVTIAQLIKRA